MVVVLLNKEVSEGGCGKEGVMSGGGRMWAKGGRKRKRMKAGRVREGE